MNLITILDLVFSMGVLIHIAPDQLLKNMKKMFQYSSKYILMGEYFNRTLISIEYQGEKDKLFKRDFGKLFIENFNVRLVDYGFLWDISTIWLVLMILHGGCLRKKMILLCNLCNRFLN